MIYHTKLLHMNMNMCIVMNMNIYITPDNENKLRNHGGSMSGLINGLLDNYFNGLSSNGRTADFDSANLGSSPSEPARPTPVTSTPKGSPAPAAYSPPVIQNLADANPQDDWQKRYDPKHPFISPFGPLPIQQVSPMAVCDPNYDDEINLPLDVDERNAWLERE